MDAVATRYRAVERLIADHLAQSGHSDVTRAARAARVAFADAEYGDLSAAELAAVLGYSRRTIWRDRALVREALGPAVEHLTAEGGPRSDTRVQHDLRLRSRGPCAPPPVAAA